MRFCLDRDGYVTRYLVSGKRDSQIRDDSRDKNQLRYEKYLRSVAAGHGEMDVTASVVIGQESQIGMPWRYYHSNGNIFVDDSGFYLELRKVELLAATQLVAEQDMQVRAYIWSYAAVDLWLNAEKTAVIEKPVYKPISRVETRLSLKKGKNDLFIRLETLGVRDTRASFAIQILERQAEIGVTYPDEKGAEPYIHAEKILDSARLDGSMLTFEDALPEGSCIQYFTGNQDFRKKAPSVIIQEAGGETCVKLAHYPSFAVEIPLAHSALHREFERMELRIPHYLETAQEDNHRAVMKDISKVASITRGANDGFALYPMIARYALGKRSRKDLEEIKVTLKQIDRRMDCADFMTCGLVRLMKGYDLGEELNREIRSTMLNFRYWMDEDGFDGMCFWSENHSLMFYQTAYFFGGEYPDDIFSRSGKTGRALAADARERILEWLEDVCTQGFDEFNSGAYTTITFAAILNLVDFAEKEIADRAVTAADGIMRAIARHCFRNVIISPQGRIYRDVIYPYAQHLQSLLQYVVPEAPYVYNEWLSALAQTKYRMPEDLTALMNQTGWQSYQTSNAQIDLYKTPDYMLTSVESPRRDGIKRVWEHHMEENDRNSFRYTRSLNECFHGTMQFEPGVYGYQQHLWYAALDTDLVVFANHPGQSCEAKSEVRPGYWYGNGITPAIRQQDNLLAVLYGIPDTHPIHFIHLFWNEHRFDEVKYAGAWLLGRKGDSYIGIWCSTALTDHDDVLFGCEKRAYGDRIGLVCICGSSAEDGCFAAFEEHCLRSHILLDEEADTLICPDFSIRYVACSNPTQYVE